MKIKSIKKVNAVSKRYDLEVKNNQNFYANNILVHNCSMTTGRIGGEFIVCSRNLNLKETEDNTFWSLARKYEIEQKMIDAGYDNLIIQGEAIGEGIEGNHYKIKGHAFYVYTIYDVIEGKYLSPQERRDVCSQLKLAHVPIIAYRANLYDTLGITSIDDVLKFSDGKSMINPDVLREGIVYKQDDGQTHWKAVSNEYLIKHGSR